MTLWRRRLTAALALLAVLPLGGAVAQQVASYSNAQDARAAYARAVAQQKEAARRGAVLEREAALARAAVEKTARQAAALAARIQQSEAKLAAAEARVTLAETARQRQLASLAERQRPLVELTAALQNLSRRPLALSVLRPGSVREMVYLRAALSAAVPTVASRTQAVRAEIARLEALQTEARRAMAAQRGAREELRQRRSQLAALETRQRLEARSRGGVAARETDRALALAERARDLDALIAGIAEQGSLRERLAALPGPILRPPRPDRSEVIVDAAADRPDVSDAPDRYQLPLAGRTLIGFGAETSGGQISQGLTLGPEPGALVAAPGAGRVAFAGPFRGYDRIVIIEHPGGWTSLVTGLGRIDVQVGDQLVAGSPLGVAGAPSPRVTLELRRDGTPVNPLDFVT